MPKEDRQVEPIKEYYIAYFDLLGYKSFFETHSDKVETFLKAIHEAIQNAKKYIEEVHSSPIVGGLGQISIRTKVFSELKIAHMLEREFRTRNLNFATLFFQMLMQKNFI